MKMNFSSVKSLSVYETFSPLYKSLKFFGIIPFELNLKTGEVSVKRLDLLWMVVKWMFWTCLIICNVHLGARELGEVSSILLTGWHSVLLFQLSASFFIQMVNLLKRNSIGKLLRILNEFDVMVNCKCFLRSHAN